MQVVKGWIDASGATHEAVHDVVWAGEDRQVENGALAPIGSSVDMKTGLTANSIGAPKLSARWVDPEFDPDQSAFYYVRVQSGAGLYLGDLVSALSPVLIPRHTPAIPPRRAWSDEARRRRPVFLPIGRLGRA